jgi:hypothetical protein
VVGGPNSMRGDSAVSAWIARAAWTIIGAGVLLRLVHLIADRNLWNDELMLAEEVLPRALGELAQPFRATGAPIGFLVVTRLMIDVLGTQDWVLRIVPFAAGCAALVLMYRIALRLLPPAAMLIAVAILAFSEPAIYYATEFKQYAGDTATACAVLLSALRVQERPESYGRMVLLAIVAVAAIWFSHPGVFVVGAAGVVLFATAAQARRWRSAAALVAIGALCVANFVATYVLSLRALVSNDFLREVWGNSFMPLSPLAAARWQAATLYDLAGESCGVTIAGVAVLAASLGTVAFARERPSVLGLLLLPIAFGICASALHAFPFVGRHTLFAAPAMCLLIAAAIYALVREARPVPRLAGVLVAALVLLPPSLRSVENAVHPKGREEIEAVLRHVAANWRRGDTLYLYYAAVRGFDRYRNAAALPDDVIPIISVRSREDWLRYETDVRQLDGRERVWVVFSHVYGTREGSEERAIIGALDWRGRRVDEVHAPGASAYMYDFRDNVTG